ncbi:siderophore-interacting protein [Leucobacter aridicollis]|uniref:NADPH-dependent ferric siderophore reductase n=1 Tax=Leucobacter aridicollis TaxID=283878 RepID=A0A852QTB6_9MICO|nr:siderophore-interacting protein [Leucobacter aridicollis]MBL3683229.1 siderophore-interacting protein [Leucobacter aridicollis]NYD25463.1 NADPH-dependent ferric siderophore reductase [Leucobacter aridicollis]
MTDRQPYDAFLTRVLRITQLTPHFTRITFGGDDLQHFGIDGLDQRIKLLLPRADGTFPELGLFDGPSPAMLDWYRRWRELPDEERNPIRTYTIRAVRPELAEIDVDFVLHGTEGPASAWAQAAAPGDELIIVGPDSRAASPAGGIEWNPGPARRVLLAGDETAAPAICAILESLPDDFSGEAFIEVPEAGDRLNISHPSGVTVTWLGRDGAPHGTFLEPAIAEWGARRLAGAVAQTDALEDAEAADPDEVLWDVPEHVVGEDYAWLAGEAGVVTRMRRHLVRDLGIDRKAVAFMGYWRIGRAEG